MRGVTQHPKRSCDSRMHTAHKPWPPLEPSLSWHSSSHAQGSATQRSVNLDNLHVELP